MAWVKSMGRQILAGNLNLVNTSFPVLMFEPRSYLQKLADPWIYPGVCLSVCVRVIVCV